MLPDVIAFVPPRIEVQLVAVLLNTPQTSLDTSKTVALSPSPSCDSAGKETS